MLTQLLAHFTLCINDYEPQRISFFHSIIQKGCTIRVCERAAHLPAHKRIGECVLHLSMGTPVIELHSV